MKKGKTGEKLTPKKLPPLMDGETMILPAVTLPPPGADAEAWWRETARPILLPRWVAESIRAGCVVWGQELREGESMKERVETITQTPGEIFKWERMVHGEGFRLSRIDWTEWDGTLEWLNGWERSEYNAKLEWWFYLLGWMKESLWCIQDYAMTETGGGDCGAIRETMKRLVLEGESALPGWEHSEDEMGGDSNLWRKRFIIPCMQELLDPPEKRRRTPGQIVRCASTMWGHFEHDFGQWWGELVGNGVIEAAKAAAEVRVQEAQAEMFKAQGWADAEAAARVRAEEARIRAEELRLEAERLAARMQGERDSWRRMAVAKRGGIVYADLVETFKAVDEKAKAHGEAATEGEVLDAMQEAREDRKMIGTMAPKKFLEMRGKWMEWGRKDADTFEKRWKAYKRTEKSRKGKS